MSDIPLSTGIEIDHIYNQNILWDNTAKLAVIVIFVTLYPEMS